MILFVDNEGLIRLRILHSLIWAFTAHICLKPRFLMACASLWNMKHGPTSFSRALDKVPFSVKIIEFFSYFSTKIYIVVLIRSALVKHF